MVEDETIPKSLIKKKRKKSTSLENFSWISPFSSHIYMQKNPKICEMWNDFKSCWYTRCSGCSCNLFQLKFGTCVDTGPIWSSHIWRQSIGTRITGKQFDSNMQFPEEKMWKINRFPLPWWFAETLAIDGCIRAVTRHYSGRTNLCLPELDTFCNISSSKLPLNRISVLRKTTQSGQMWLRCQMPYSSETSLIVDCCYCSLVRTMFRLTTYWSVWLVLRLLLALSTLSMLSSMMVLSAEVMLHGNVFGVERFSQNNSIRAEGL